jgi:hypothetical protein
MMKMRIEQIIEVGLEAPEFVLLVNKFLESENVAPMTVDQMRTKVAAILEELRLDKADPIEFNIVVSAIEAFAERIYRRGYDDGAAK